MIIFNLSRLHGLLLKIFQIFNTTQAKECSEMESIIDHVTRITTVFLPDEIRESRHILPEKRSGNPPQETSVQVQTT